MHHYGTEPDHCQVRVCIIEVAELRQDLRGFIKVKADMMLPIPMYSAWHVLLIFELICDSSSLCLILEMR